MYSLKAPPLTPHPLRPQRSQCSALRTGRPHGTAAHQSLLTSCTCEVQPELRDAGERVVRDDFVLKNGRGLALQCSHWWRRWEKEDLKPVLGYLRTHPKVTLIGLWGRSMGAATALMHLSGDPSISATVLDSPFGSLPVLVHELVEKKGSSWVPSWLVDTALSSLRDTISKKVTSRAFSSCGIHDWVVKANFDISDLVPRDHARRCIIPALFGTARGDDFVQPRHSRDLYELYGCKTKELVEFNGNHRSQRPLDFIQAGISFLQEFMQDTEGPLAAMHAEQPVEQYLSDVARQAGDGQREGAFHQPEIESDVLTRIRTFVHEKREATHEQGAEATDQPSGQQEQRSRGFNQPFNETELELLTYCNNFTELFTCPKYQIR